MKANGKGLWIIGAVILAYAIYGYDTSVSVGGGDRVVNLDLQRRQLLFVILGALMVLVGVILHAMGQMKAGGVEQVTTPVEKPTLPPARDLAAELAAERAKLEASKAASSLPR